MQYMAIGVMGSGFSDEQPETTKPAQGGLC
jgi:hypothetical protein